jgi:hypothetical protein
MFITEFIKHFFIKKQIKTYEQLKLKQGLEKWELMKKTDSATLRTFAFYSKFDDFASALVHADKQILSQVLDAVSVIHCNNVPVKLIWEKLIKKHSNITKDQSDKMKVHLMNNIFPKN